MEKERRCENCRYYQAPHSDEEHIKEFEKPTGKHLTFYGQCRYYPPKVVDFLHYEDWGPVTAFPEVAPNDWCGKFEPKETD